MVQEQAMAEPPSNIQRAVETAEGSPNMSTLNRGLNRHPQHYMGTMEKPPPPQPPPQPQRERSQSEMGGRDPRGRYLSDTTFYRNTLLHGAAPEKDFRPGAQWTAAPAAQGRTTPLSPEKISDTFAAFQQVQTGEVRTAEGATIVDLDPSKLEAPTPTPQAPAGTGTMQRGGQHQQQQPRIPSRASSVYSGISAYGPRRMTEGAIHPQPMLFQPIPQQWPLPAYAYTQPHYVPQPPPAPIVGQIQHQQQQAERGTPVEVQGGQRATARSLSRSASEMGPSQRSAFVAATLPRKPPSGLMHQPVSGRTSQLSTATLQRPPSAVEFRHELAAADFQPPPPVKAKEAKKSPAASEGYGSDSGQDKATSTASASADGAVAAAVKGGETEEARFLAKLRAAEERRRELANWDGLGKLSVAHCLLGAILVGLGLARLAKMSVWGLGVELVWGLLVIVAGVLGIVGARKRHFGAVTAHCVLAVALAALAVLPFTVALMVTVPDTFGDVGEEHRRYFTNDNGMYGWEVATGALVLVEALLCVASAVLGCAMAGKALELRQSELRAAPFPVLPGLRLAPPNAPPPPQLLPPEKPV